MRGKVNHAGGKHLPSKSSIAEIALDLLRLLFPGFFDGPTIHSSAMKDVTDGLLGEVISRLIFEIAKSLKYAPPDGVSQTDIPKLAQKQTFEFLSALPWIRELLETDTDAAYEGDPAALSREEVVLAYPL
ncbi:MAG: hypothetical protein JO138_13545 [Acidobacteriaceae bacterium]|nr:hypothetical protein [Acidobacteriaceae bacterium]